MIEASPALTPNSRATCGSSGSAARMVATEANAAALKSAIGRRRDGSRMPSLEPPRAPVDQGARADGRPLARARLPIHAASRDAPHGRRRSALARYLLPVRCSRSNSSIPMA